MDIKHLHLYKMQINLILGFTFTESVSPIPFTHTTLVHIIAYGQFPH